jgi:hypothetical protein
MQSCWDGFSLQIECPDVTPDGGTCPDGALVPVQQPRAHGAPRS